MWSPETFGPPDRSGKTVTTAVRYTDGVRLALLLWGMGWAYVATPWRSFRSRPSLRNVELIPFLDGSLRTQVLNVLVFVPLGIIGTRLGWSPRTVALVGVSISALTELLQLFSTRRHPSVTDVILNVTGTLIGVALAVAWSNARVVSAPDRPVRVLTQPPTAAADKVLSFKRTSTYNVDACSSVHAVSLMMSLEWVLIRPSLFWRGWMRARLTASSNQWTDVTSAVGRLRYSAACLDSRGGAGRRR